MHGGRRLGCMRGHRSMYIFMYAKLYIDNLAIHPCVSLKNMCTRFSISNTATMVHLPVFVIYTTHNIKHIEYQIIFFCHDVWEGFTT